MKWTHKKASTVKSTSTPETDVEQLSEPEEEEEDTKPQEEPPAKRRRFRKVPPTSDNLTTEEDQEQAESVAGEGNDDSPNQAKKKRNIQPPIAATPLSRRKNSPADVAEAEATASKTKTDARMLKGKLATKGGSRSVESAVLGQVKSVAHSRSSSPGSTDLKPRRKGLPKAGELSRSSSLDNLLYKSKSAPIPKHTRSKTFHKKGNDASEEVSDPDPAPFDAKSDKSKSVLASLKRKHFKRPLGDNQTESLTTIKKQRLLTRLQDSSTHQMPNILLSGRASRFTAQGHSPAVSRESSPGSVSKGKGRKEHADSDVGLDRDSVGQMKEATTREKEEVEDDLSEDEDKSQQEDAGVPDSSKLSDHTPVLEEDGASRRRGRPKGSAKRKFRLNHVKRHSIVAIENLKKLQAFKTKLGERRLGRPRKAGSQREVVDQPADSEMKNSSPDKHEVSGSDDAADTKALPQKTTHGKTTPLKSSQVMLDTESVSAITKAEDSKTPPALPVKKKKGRPRKILPIPVDVKPGDSSQESSKNEVKFSSEEKCEVGDDLSATVKTTNNFTDSEKPVNMSSSLPEQPCSDTVPESMDVTEDSHLSSGLADEDGSAGTVHDANKLRQKTTSEKSNTLQTLVHMRRESRRQMKKSRWATGRLPKQSPAAQSSAVRFKKQSSTSSDKPVGSETRAQEERSDDATERSHSPSADINDGEMEMTVKDMLQDQPADSCTTHLGASSQGQVGVDAPGSSVAEKDSVDHKSDDPSLAEPVSSEKSDSTAEGVDEAKTQHASTEESKAVVDDLGQETRPAPASEDKSLAAGEPLSTTEDQIEVKPEADRESSRSWQSKEASLCDQPEDSSMQDQTEEPSTPDHVEETVVQDQAEKLSAQNQCEELPSEESEQPSMQDNSEKSSTQEQSLESPVQDVPEEPPTQDQSEKESTQDTSERLPTEESEDTQKSEEPSGEDRSMLDQPEPSTQGHTEESSGHDVVVQPVTELSSPSDQPASDQTQTKSDASFESGIEPQHSSDISSGQSGSEQPQSRPDTSVEHADHTQAPISSDTSMPAEVEDVPRDADNENFTKTDAESQPEVLNKDCVTSELAAGQQQEVKPEDAGVTAEDAQAQIMTEASSPTNVETGQHLPAVTSPTKQETGDSEPQLSTTEAATAEAGDSKQDLTTKSDIEISDSKPQVTPTDIDQAKENVLLPSASCDKVGESEAGKASETEGAQSITESAHVDASFKGAGADEQGSSSGKLTEEKGSVLSEESRTEDPDKLEPSGSDLSTADDQSLPRMKRVPIAKRKQKAISRELKRLQTDEGAQKIMSWHEKRKLKSFGKLLRSKIKGVEEDTKIREEMNEASLRFPSSKTYSIDAISDTRLVFKSGKSGNSGTVPEKPESVHDLSAALDKEKSSSGDSRRFKRGVLSVSSSMDSEDGLPPDITEMPPYKDSRLERCRSEELSPPPLIRPEDLFSEEYYESMSVNPALQYPAGKSSASDTVAPETESGAAFPRMKYVTDSVMTHAGVDTLPESEASGAFLGAKKLGPRKKRGRGKRKHGKMGPASKTGRELHIKPGPASSKIARRTSSPKQDPPFVRAMPHLPSEPRTFALRPKTTRSPIEIIAMKQKLEEEAYELEEATRVARKLKRRQALFGRLAMANDLAPNQNLASCCKPCSVVLVDFVKELHLNSIDTSDQYISDVSYDSDEEDVDDEDDDFEDDIYGCQMDANRLVLGIHESPESSPRLMVRPHLVPGASSSPPEVRKMAPDLDSLRGKGFMGNFVDFIQNRNNQPFNQPQKRRPHYRPRTPAASEEHPASVNSLSVVNSVSVLCTSNSVVSSPCLTTMSTSSSTVVSVPSLSQFVTSAQVHTPQQTQGGKGDHRTACPEEDKTVSSSPSQAAESSHLVSVEKLQHSPHPHTAVVKPSAEKSSFPGKLKVFPTRKESEGTAADKTAFTRYLCSKCDFSATNKGTIESHIYRHIPGVTFTCGYCESEFTGLISALTHVKNSHNSKEPKVWISKDINEASLYAEEEIQACPDSVVSSAHSYQQEAGVGESADTSGQVQEGPPVFISLVVSGDRQVPRTERFSSSPLATQRRFACTHCSYCTNVVDDAHQHVRDLHSHSSLYTCYLCDKAIGWSHQDIVAHCSATHPDRPKSFEKLPDFYDQELLRVNSGAGDRSKSSEDRGNIFDRMSNFFPNLGPGSELMEDGQMSPQARFLRARDYLCIHERWSKKTRAEADSTTIEDVEIPPEDGGDVDSCGLDSTSGEQPSDSAQLPLTSAISKTLSSSQTTSKDTSGVADDSARPSSQQTGVPQDIRNSDLHAFKPSENAASKTSHAAGLNSVPSKVSRIAGDGTSTATARSAAGDGTLVSTALPAMVGGPSGERRQEARGAGVEGEQPPGKGAEVEGEDDVETDILVIDLGEDVEDIADDTSHCSSAQEESPESSFTEANTHAAKAASMEKEPSCRVGEEQHVSDHGFKTPSTDRLQPAGLAVTDDSAAKSDDNADDDSSMGIKILSVVSLSDRGGDHVADLSLSPVKSLSGSDQESSSSSSTTTTPPSSGKKLSPGKRAASSSSSSTPTPKASPSPSRKKGSAKHLPEVDADEMAVRNERMVCTYKCHSCSIHSPALAAIVEHLKQHHHDVPLFSCPYCKSKKEPFFTEESVHTHVSQQHPSNYAKNEVSLSEVAKSFVQVLALPSGQRVRGSLIEEDIYMCLQCESHIPDLDYALRHLKHEHPGLLKYACPICGKFSHSAQAVVKKHLLEAHGQTADSVQLAMAMEGVYLTKVTCVSASGQYVDHATPPKASAPAPVPAVPGSLGSTAQGAGLAASALSRAPLSLGAAGGPSVSRSVVPIPVTRITPLSLTAIQDQAPSTFLSGSSGHAKSGKHKTKSAYSGSNVPSPASNLQHPRPILPMPGSLASLGLVAKKGDSAGIPFLRTSMTVKDILDTRQKTVEAPSLPVALDSSALAALSMSVPASEQLHADSLTPRGLFSVADKASLGRGLQSASPSGVPFSSGYMPSSPVSSRPVLKVPNVSSVLDLTSPSRCSSVDTGTSVNTLLAGVPLTSSAVAALASAGKHLSSLPFSPSGSLGSLTVPASPKEREDPEAFKIFNLKPRTPVPQSSPRPGASPAVSAHKPSPSPSLLAPVSSSHASQTSTVVSAAAVTMVSSALFPQQFPLQQFPPVQPPTIATLPLAQGGLPLAQNFTLPIGAGLPLTIPLSVSQTPLLMAPNTFPPVLVPASLLPQLGMRGPMPQLPVVSATATAAPPPAHQPVSDMQMAPVNLSLTQPARHTASAPPPPILKTKSCTTSPAGTFSSFQLKSATTRGRGRPRLHQKTGDPKPKPIIPGSCAPRLPAPASIAPRPIHSGPVAAPVRQSEAPAPSPKPQRQSTTHQCVCPYCSDTVILKPWEVAQHIKVLHPGKEVKYNRV